MLDEAQIAALLHGLPDHASRSGLEPYRELVLEMRRRNFSYRQVAKVLVKRCGFEISHSSIHDFIRKHCDTTLPATSTQCRGADETGNFLSALGTARHGCLHP